MTTATTQPLWQFITTHGLTMRATLSTTSKRPENFKDSTRWNIVLMRRAGQTRLRLPFYMGSGHNGESPSIATVLDCLASDASSIENARDFADWASEYGYDTDSRKAERSYKDCQRLTNRLRDFLTPEQYESLLWHTESDPSATRSCG